MIRVFHGEDSYTISQEIRKIKNKLGHRDIASSNVSIFDNHPINFHEFLSTSKAIPFMSDRRIIIISNLLSKIQNKVKSISDEWLEFYKYVDEIPPTSEVIFVENIELKNNGNGLNAVGDKCEVKVFQKKKGYELENWIKNKILESKAMASPNAIKKLSWITSGDLYRLENEINKLSLYVGDREINVSDVNKVISSSRQSNIFLFIDAVMDKKAGVALNELYSLILDGVSIGQIINMLARQVRLLILCKDLSSKNLSREDIGKRIFINNNFVLEKTLAQSNRFDFENLIRIQKQLLTTDISIKNGTMEQRAAVEILASELSK
ncbi:MAG: DNA polymerase III subunit delta [Chloroflexi bacterium]|nr:DNA polymerase III subunit delta [Chloroflexota bacterium]|tara:strand:- start:12714 stop:13679 length:966 start_codon:yes stop_codon:yes gene_type:complete